MRTVRMGVVHAGWAAVLALAALPAAAQPAAPKPDPAPEKRFTLWGVGQVDYRRAVGEVPKAAPEHEFHLRRARFIFTGSITDRIAFNFSVQGNGVSENRVLDMNVDFTLTPWLKLRAGQNKYEFDIEGREPFHANPFQDRSFAANAVAGGLGGASTASLPTSSFRDRGVGALVSRQDGGLKWGFAAGAYQGVGFALDNNSSFSLTVNGTAETRGLRLNGGYIYSPSADEDAPEKNDYSAWTLGFSYDKGRFLVRGEYYGGERDRGATREDVSGFYLMGGVTLAKRLDVGVRYQRLADGRFPENDDRLSSVDLQARLFLDRKDRRSGTSLTAGVMLREADAGFDRGVTLLNDGRGAALSRGGDVDAVFLARVQIRF
ncbi:MAG TPA: porin [Vicinamibacteria bacterium]|nr:porin [Vicinamibacteria bacterium]